MFYYQLTVPEGFNLFDIATALDKLGIITGREFLEAARDPSPIRDLAPEARTLEGYLFPTPIALPSAPRPASFASR